MLALMNTRINKISEMLREHKIDYVDILMKVPRETRETMGSVVNLLKLIFYPLDKKSSSQSSQVLPPFSKR